MIAVLDHAPAELVAFPAPFSEELAELNREKQRRYYATWCGEQTFPGVPPLKLWTLTTDITGHPAGSTVTQETLDAAIFGHASK